MFAAKPSVSVEDILRRIDQRQRVIDRTLKVSDDQMEDIEQELQKRVDVDPGVRFRQAELEWFQRRRAGGLDVRH